MTRADVARYAGVSTAVVSYVVNAGPKAVSPATSKRVADAVRILGYRPNQSARALRTGSTQLLGLVLPELANPLFAELALAIEAAAAQQGFETIVTNTESNIISERRKLAKLTARQVDGLILATPMSHPDLSVAANGTPTIMLNAFKDVPGLQSVGVNAFEGARSGVQHLIDHGHRNVALTIGDDGSGVVEQRELGWLAATRSAGLPDGRVARVPFTRAGGHLAGRRLFEGVDRPTAVFCASDLQAAGMLRALWELNLRVPHDVAIVSFDGTEESEFATPPLTTVRQPIDAMAVDVMDRLVDAIRHPERHVVEHSVHQTELVVRSSCGCPTANDPAADGAPSPELNSQLLQPSVKR